MYYGLPLRKVLIDVFVLNFKEMCSARVRVRKTDFCIVLAGKQLKYRDRAPLSAAFTN